MPFVIHGLPLLLNITLELVLENNHHIFEDKYKVWSDSPLVCCAQI